MLNSKKIMSVINKLSHSEGRVPYTYHHDYLRMKTCKFNGASRSEVAQNHDENKDELYAVALTYLVESMCFTEFTKLSADDIIVCKEANNITKEILKKYP